MWDVWKTQLGGSQKPSDDDWRSELFGFGMEIKILFWQIFFCWGNQRKVSWMYKSVFLALGICRYFNKNIDIKMRTRMEIIIMILGGTFAEWSALWTRNPVVSSSGDLLDFFSVVPSLKPRPLLQIKSQLVESAASWVLYLNYLFLNI